MNDVIVQTTMAVHSMHPTASNLIRDIYLGCIVGHSLLSAHREYPKNTVSLTRA